MIIIDSLITFFFYWKLQLHFFFGQVKILQQQHNFNKHATTSCIDPLSIVFLELCQILQPCGSGTAETVGSWQITCVERLKNKFSSLTMKQPDWDLLEATSCRWRWFHFNILFFGLWAASYTQTMNLLQISQCCFPLFFYLMLYSLYCCKLHSLSCKVCYMVSIFLCVVCKCLLDVDTRMQLKHLEAGFMEALMMASLSHTRCYTLY